MRTHDQVVKKLMRRPGVRAEVERLGVKSSLCSTRCSRRVERPGSLKQKWPSEWEPKLPR